MFKLMVNFTDRNKASVLIIAILSHPFALVSLRIVCLQPRKRVHLYEFFATLHYIVQNLLSVQTFVLPRNPPLRRVSRK